MSWLMERTRIVTYLTTRLPPWLSTRQLLWLPVLYCGDLHRNGPNKGRSVCCSCNHKVSSATEKVVYVRIPEL